MSSQQAGTAHGMRCKSEKLRDSEGLDQQSLMFLSGKMHWWPSSLLNIAECPSSANHDRLRLSQSCSKYSTVITRLGWPLRKPAASLPDLSSFAGASFGRGSGRVAARKSGRRSNAAQGAAFFPRHVGNSLMAWRDPGQAQVTQVHLL